jgi:hypothetical protein
MESYAEYVSLLIGWTVGISFMWTFRFEWIGLFFTLLVFVGIIQFCIHHVLYASTSAYPMWEIAFFLGLFLIGILQTITAAYLGLFFVYIWNTFHRRASFADFTRALYTQWQTVKMAWTWSGFFTLLLGGLLFGIMFPNTKDPLFPASLFPVSNLFTDTVWTLPIGNQKCCSYSTLWIGLAAALWIGGVISSGIGIGYMIPLYNARHNIQPKRETPGNTANIRPVRPYNELWRRNTIQQLSDYSYR